MTFSNISTKRRSHSAAELNFLIISSSSFSPLAFVRDPELNCVLPVQGNLHSDVYQQSYNVTYRCMYFLQYFLLIILLYLDWKTCGGKVECFLSTTVPFLKVSQGSEVRNVTILHIVALTLLPCSLLPSFLPLISSTWGSNRDENWERHRTVLEVWPSLCQTSVYNICYSM